MKHPFSLTQRQKSETLNSLTPLSGVGGLLKKLFLSAGLVLAMSGALRAQDCATGYCPTTITVHHKVGAVSPVTVDITYGVDKNSYSGTMQCWITRNLGATTQATAWNDATTASAGWYWQFNRKQGYSFSTGSRVPSTTWESIISETNDWVTANDPCTLLLGSTWRIPTYTELYTTLNTSLGTFAVNSLYGTTLKLHAGGYIHPSNPAVVTSSSLWGIWWVATSSSATIAYHAECGNGSGSLNNSWSKTYATSLRCLRTY